MAYKTYEVAMIGIDNRFAITYHLAKAGVKVLVEKGDICSGARLLTGFSS